MTHISGQTTIHMVEETGPNLFQIPPGDGRQTTIRTNGGGPYTHYKFGLDSSIVATTDDPVFGPAQTSPEGYEFTFAYGAFPTFISLLNTAAAQPGRPSIMGIWLAVGN